MKFNSGFKGLMQRCQLLYSYLQEVWFVITLKYTDSSSAPLLQTLPRGNVTRRLKRRWPADL